MLRAADETVTTTAPSEQCVTCARFHASGVTCDAFPDGIAPEILAGRFDHTQPHPLDNGLRYKPLNIDPEAPGGD